LQVKTTKFGTIEINETDIITFNDGLPGFPDEHQFVIIPYEEESPFVYLQSATEDYLAFIMASPFLFFPDYEFELDEANMKELDINSDKDIAIYVMITVPKQDVKQMTANLVAPVVINVHTRQAKQTVLEKSQYQTKHKLFTINASHEGGK
jgi:flagellar assembly factor FliW